MIATLTLNPTLDIFVMSGSIPLGVKKDIYSKLIKIAHRKGIKTVLDTDGKPLYLGLKAKPFLIKPNIYETQRLLEKIHGRKVKILTESDLVSAARNLSKTAKIVIISWGPRGIIVTSEGKFWRSRPPIKLKYTGVGAGDAAVAGFVYGLSMNKGIEDCIRFGVACGTAATLQKGTRLCNAKDVLRLLKKIEIYRLR